MNSLELWQRYKKYTNFNPTVGITLDISRMKFAENFFSQMEQSIQSALTHLQKIEEGDIANPDENRMVGHYWLRNALLAPDTNLKKAILDAITSVKEFANDIHTGSLLSQHGQPFKNVLVIGIGGSALGPQFVSQALGTSDDQMTPFFFDNTDPDGMDIVLSKIGPNLSETLTIVISKSGGTKETRNGMLEAKAAYEREGLDFSKHAVATTGEGSALEKTALADGWLKIFPMWDWVGGRTSELSAVGLLPAALQGIDIERFLEGASEMDQVTRQAEALNNPAALLALMWYYAGDGKGKKDMVILPYKDRLQYLSRYLQQLIMESLGKEFDLDGTTVNQGIVVYGNKGSTDQHAYVQQLREGPTDFFVTFIKVMQERNTATMEVEPHITSGDYLQGFLLGTRQALYEKDRESITITMENVNAFSVGALIALYERAVGLYAHLVHINAYHQPGVEAGKKAAGVILSIQVKLIEHLQTHRGQDFTLQKLASDIEKSDSIELVYHIMEQLVANDRGIQKDSGSNEFEGSYRMV